MADDLSFLSKSQLHLLEYYSELRAQRAGLPSRTEISLTRLRPILSWVVLGDYNPPGELVAKVVGSSIDEALGISLTGVNMFEVYPEDWHDTFREFFGNICDQPCGGFIERNIETRSGLVKGFKTLYMPLLGQDGEAGKFIGAGSVDTVALSRPGFGTQRKPGEINTLQIRYLDIGFGVPA